MNTGICDVRVWNSEQTKSEIKWKKKQMDTDLCFGPHPVARRAYSWLWTQKLLLAQETIWNAEDWAYIYLGQLWARQKLYHCVTTSPTHLR